MSTNLPEVQSAKISGPWAAVADLPCEVAVELSVNGVRLADVLALAPGSLVRTQALVASDVPLRMHGELIAWCEFELVHDRLSVRLTELA